jgi:uncharacterized protein YegP (UPF0339 family)
MSEHTVFLYRDKAGEWRWKRQAENTQIVADSGEGYANYSDCREMAEAVNGDVAYVDLHTQ